jgi:hypothetical protein
MCPRHFRANVLALVLGVTCNRAAGVASANDKAPAPNRDSRIEALVCAGRPDCRLESLLDGGRSQQGAELYVAMVQMPSDDYGTMCTLRDAWVVSAVRDDVRSVHRIFQQCTVDTPPERPPFVEARPRGEFRYAWGLEPDQWSSAPTPALGGFDFTVDPLADVRNFWGRAYWDHTKFQGAVCGKGTSVDNCVEPSLTLPSLDLGYAFAAGGWRTTSLGDCSMRFGLVRVLLSPDALYVELPVSADATPLQVQIEMYRMGPPPADRFSWTLGVDGSLTLDDNGEGRKIATHAEKVDVSSSVRRFRLTNLWPSKHAPESMHMSYGADSPGIETRMGFLQPAKAACSAHGATLEVVPERPTSDPSEPLWH